MITWNVFGANSEAHQSLFQSGWFIEGLLSQTLIVHVTWPVMVRTVPWLVGVLLAYCTLTQLVKTWYVRTFNTWL